ncbi:MAG: hypothetical protein JWP36_304 [Paucimonas sp.]|nr:hypothetical protein [Paucimonas sp.]
MTKSLLPLLLLALTSSVFAQGTANTDAEGRPTVNRGASRELVRLCNNEARDNKLAGAERRRFIRDCVRGDGAASTAAASGGPAQGTAATPDPDGRIDREMGQGLTRAQAKACREEANAQKLKGADRRRYWADCSKKAQMK